MQIPALWTDLDEKQRTLGRNYVMGVFYAVRGVMASGHLYTVGVCKDPYAACGLCQVPIGRNHNCFKSAFENPALIEPPMCFDCIEDEYKRLFPEAALETPAFLDRYREVKFW